MRVQQLSITIHEQMLLNIAVKPFNSFKTIYGVLSVL